MTAGPGCSEILPLLEKFSKTCALLLRPEGVHFILRAVDADGMQMSAGCSTVYFPLYLPLRQLSCRSYLHLLCFTSIPYWTVDIVAAMLPCVGQGSGSSTGMEDGLSFWVIINA